MRRDYIVHLKGTFPKMADHIKHHGTYAWFTDTFAVDEHGNKVANGKLASTGEDDDEDNGESQQPASEEPVASSYSCLKPLTMLCDSWPKF